MNKKKSLERPLSVKMFKSFYGNIHYAYRFDKLGVSYELCMEPCANGFNVALYELYKKGRLPQIVIAKVCTNVDGYADDHLGQRERSKIVWEKALTIAEFLLDYYFK